MPALWSERDSCGPGCHRPVDFIGNRPPPGTTLKDCITGYTSITAFNLRISGIVEVLPTTRAERCRRIKS